MVCDIAGARTRIAADSQHRDCKLSGFRLGPENSIGGVRSQQQPAALVRAPLGVQTGISRLRAVMSLASTARMRRGGGKFGNGQRHETWRQQEAHDDRGE